MAELMGICGADSHTTEAVLSRMACHVGTTGGAHVRRWTWPGLGLLHCTPSETSARAQPATSADGRLVLAVDGEPLRRDDAAPGGVLSPGAVLGLYLEEGEALRGEYLVRIRLEKLGGENPPIGVTLGARVGPKTYAAEFELGQPSDERELRLEL